MLVDSENICGLPAEDVPEFHHGGFTRNNERLPRRGQNFSPLTLAVIQNDKCLVVVGC